MRSVIFATCAALLMTGAATNPAVAGYYNAQGKYVCDMRMSALLAKYPNGGDALVSELIALLKSDPTLASDVSCEMGIANATQKTALTTALNNYNNTQISDSSGSGSGNAYVPALGGGGGGGGGGGCGGVSPIC